MALRTVLEPLGREVVTAPSGEEALKRLLQDDFSVIVMDVRMPGLDGFQTVELIKRQRPDRVVDGEMQADTAVMPEIVEQRYPFSQVKDANVLVFPSLESANIAYKLLARLGSAQAIGPILLGIGAPVHVLQTGDEVKDIVNIAAVAVMDALSRS